MNLQLEEELGFLPTGDQWFLTFLVINAPDAGFQIKERCRLTIKMGAARWKESPCLKNQCRKRFLTKSRLEILVIINFFALTAIG